MLLEPVLLVELLLNPLRLPNRILLVFDRFRQHALEPADVPRADEKPPLPHHARVCLVPSTPSLIDVKHLAPTQRRTHHVPALLQHLTCCVDRRAAKPSEQDGDQFFSGGAGSTWRSRAASVSIFVRLATSCSSRAFVSSRSACAHRSHSLAVPRCLHGYTFFGFGIYPSLMIVWPFGFETSMTLLKWL